MSDASRSKIMTCPSCGVFDPKTERLENEEFLYGVGRKAVMLRAIVPVMSCRHCGIEWTDDRGEDARQNVIEKHLKLRS